MRTESNENSKPKRDELTRNGVRTNNETSCYFGVKKTSMVRHDFVRRTFYINTAHRLLNPSSSSNSLDLSANPESALRLFFQKSLPQTMADQNVTRFTSCRGVSFEINPHASPFSVSADRPSAPWLRLPWTLYNSGRVLPLQDDGPLSLGRSSSYFCDVYSDEEHDEDVGMAIPEEDSDDVEKQQQPAPRLPEPKEQREVDKPVTTRMMVLLQLSSKTRE